MTFKWEWLKPRYWLTWIGLAILRLFSILPLPLLAVMGYMVGLLFYLVIPSRRKIAYTNISACFPELSPTERKTINRRHFCLLGQSLLTVGVSWWASPQRLNRLVTLHGRQHYDEALAQGRNIIILAPHFISLDMAGMVLSQERPMITMYQYSKNTLINDMVKARRGRFDGVLIERKEPMRHLLRQIRKGLPFYYLPDQDAGRKGIFVPFFNHQASTYAVLGKFASLSNAVVIPCQNKIKPWGLGYDAILGEPLTNYPSGDDTADTETMNQAVEAMIRDMPEQYFWVHKRFKTRPESEPKFYN